MLAEPSVDKTVQGISAEVLEVGIWVQQQFKKKTVIYTLVAEMLFLMQCACVKVLEVGYGFIPVFFWKHSVSRDRYGYSNNPKKNSVSEKAACHQVRGHYYIGLVTVTVSVPGCRVGMGRGQILDPGAP